MFCKLLCFAPALALVVLFGSDPGTVSAQGRDHLPRLHAALHELIAARRELREARDNWPPGNKERALAAIDDAVRSLRTILAVKDDNVRGMERGADFYKRFQDHPRLRAALQDLREARQELREARADFGNMKERARDDIDIAIGHIAALLRR